MDKQAEILYSAHALLGEGPVWHDLEQRLYWLDIEGLMLHRFDPANGIDESFPLPNQTGCLVPCRNGNLLLATQTGIEEVRLTSRITESVTENIAGNVAENAIENAIEIIETNTKIHPESQIPENRYNDGKCSPEGRFWFGSLNKQRQQGRASLYVLDGDGCRTAITGATNSNGLAWSPNGNTFYWIDTPTLRVDAFDYHSGEGKLSNRRTVIAFPNISTENNSDNFGRPDGMTIDSDGMLWIAHWLGGRITRWNPVNGQLLETIRLPVSRVTSLTFGGSELKTIFITTASLGLTPEMQPLEPNAGGLFVYESKIAGLPVSYYSS
ncbi:MAG: SMP-30/gluconolactonase/LRE family protein [Planctomycetaceae bacterium]|jgi:sugar lactone lactonase YvrE|nr:SMP-30/gluconolactonase/LRE family protein [Planctomycetaceae bacterium]